MLEFCASSVHELFAPAMLVRSRVYEWMSERKELQDDTRQRKTRSRTNFELVAFFPSCSRVLPTLFPCFTRVRMLYMIQDS